MGSFGSEDAAVFRSENILGFKMGPLIFNPDKFCSIKKSFKKMDIGVGERQKGEGVKKKKQKELGIREDQRNVLEKRYGDTNSHFESGLKESRFAFRKPKFLTKIFIYLFIYLKKKNERDDYD